MVQLRGNETVAAAIQEGGEVKIKKTPEEVLGRYIARKAFTLYELGDYHYDAREILTALARNGFKVIPRHPAKKGGRGK
jgi:hypothetical protein